MYYGVMKAFPCTAAAVGRFLLAISIVVFAGGCVHVRSIDETHGVRMQHFNSVAGQSTVLVRFRDGSSMHARQLRAANGVVQWVDPFTGRRVSASIDEVFEIQVKDRSVGMFDGLGLGILAGATIGLMADLSMRSVDPESPSPESQGASGGATVVGGMLAGGFGLVIGGARGATRCYRFVRSRPVYADGARP